MAEPDDNTSIRDAARTGLFYPNGNIYVDADGVRLCPACGAQDPDCEHEGAGTQVGAAMECFNRPGWYAGRTDIKLVAGG